MDDVNAFLRMEWMVDGTYAKAALYIEDAMRTINASDDNFMFLNSFQGSLVSVKRIFRL